MAISRCNSPDPGPLPGPPGGIEPVDDPVNSLQHVQGEVLASRTRSLAHVLPPSRVARSRRIRSSLRPTLLKLHPRRSAISSWVYPSIFISAPGGAYHRTAIPAGVALIADQRRHLRGRSRRGDVACLPVLTIRVGASSRPTSFPPPRYCGRACWTWSRALRSVMTTSSRQRSLRSASWG